MAIVTGDRYLEKLERFVEVEAGPLIDGTKVLKLNPAGLHYVQLRLEALHELERLLSGAPVDYLRAYVSDLGDHRALEQLRRILRLLTSLKVVSTLPEPARDPTPPTLLPFGRLKVLELRGCDLSSSAAKGLLELRHTLEKIICHNSTDALRHVFASRIAEIMDSPQWNKLSFVSCACNRLVLMDESLQLLPAVETLDLSRNKFAKVDNLRRCTKLKHLDLGFNHLRTISHFSELSCHIVKLVLRNNALTTLRGIENLKSLEGLDLSYNAISNFSELEFFANLLMLRSLWLEGNPICCARWYRPQVFSYFTYPDELKLDDKEIGKREFWKRQIIIAHRHKRPASFGFYSPAKEDAEEESIDDRKRKKMSRLALINAEEESVHICSDQDSASCDNDIQRKEEKGKADDESEALDLIKKAELLKKECSVHWLREFKDWMDHSSENSVDACRYDWDSQHEKKNNIKSKKSQMRHGESSGYASDYIRATRDGNSINTSTSDNQFADMPTGSHNNSYLGYDGTAEATGGISKTDLQGDGLNQEYSKLYLHEGVSLMSLEPASLKLDASSMGARVVENDCASMFSTIDDITESRSTSARLGSPPHYQEGILHRRHDLVEEFLQLSADSFSMASSDSTSCSEDEIYDSGQSISSDDQPVNQQYLNMRQEQYFSSSDSEDDTSDQVGVTRDGEPPPAAYLEGHSCEKRTSRRKPKKRVVSLSAENSMLSDNQTQKPTQNLDICGTSNVDAWGRHLFDGRDHQMVIDKCEGADAEMTDAGICGNSSPSPENHDLVKDYFEMHVADSRTQETCRFYMRCDCLLEQDSVYKEREVALLLSSEKKLYVLLVGLALGEPGSNISLLGWHRVEDVQDVVVGLGLQVVRINIEDGSTYIFITKSIQKSTQLLYTLQLFDSKASNAVYSLRSLEQVQVELFEKQICGGLKLSIFQYSLVLFWRNDGGAESWLLRSLFMVGGYLLVCDEDFMQFSALSSDASSKPYFLPESCCSVADVSELAIGGKETPCSILRLERSTSEFSPSAEASANNTETDKKKTDSESLTWKLRWFSEDSQFKFVTLLKALHARTTASPLLVRYV